MFRRVKFANPGFNEEFGQAQILGGLSTNSTLATKKKILFRVLMNLRNSKKKQNFYIMRDHILPFGLLLP
jgi:hypothetical protein